MRTKVVAVILAVFLLLVLAVGSGKCAIALDTATSQHTAGATSITWSQTCTGSDLVLVVDCVVTGANTVDSVTYNGVAMNQVQSVSNSNIVSYVFILVDPSTGANNVIVYASASTVITGIATSYTGVDGTTPYEHVKEEHTDWQAGGSNELIVWVDAASPEDSSGAVGDYLHAGAYGYSADSIGVYGSAGQTITGYWWDAASTGIGTSSYAPAAAGNDSIGAIYYVSGNSTTIMGMVLNAAAAAVDTCCTITTSPIAFGSVDTGTVDTTAFIITNCGTDTYGGTVVAADLAAPYSMVESGGDLAWNLAADASDTFNIIFTPTSIGEALDTLSAGHDSCETIYVSGTGAAVDDTICTIYTSPLAFGSVDTGQTKVDSFYIKNEGDIALVDSIDWSLNPVYTAQSDSAYNLSAGDSLWFSLQFAPTSVTSYPDTQDMGHAECADLIISGTGAAVGGGEAGWTYISPTGNNSIADGSKSNPYQTLCYYCTNGYTENQGDTIVYMEGTHTLHQLAGVYCEAGGNTMRGTSDAWVVIMGDPDAATRPIINRGNVGENYSGFNIKSSYSEPDNNHPYDDVAYLKIVGIDFDSCGQCIAMDDGGYPDSEHDSRTTPSHHIIIEDCNFRRSRNPIKFAGIDTFLIKDCTGDSCTHAIIDFVGCHYGTVTGCVFKHANAPYLQGLGIMVKGGSGRITIAKNYFHGTGIFGINFGQNTGLAFFRPEWGGTDWEDSTVNYEVKDISAYANVFRYNCAAITFTRSVRGKIYNNTMYSSLTYISELFPSGAMYFMFHLRNDGQGLSNPTPTDTRHCKFKNNIVAFDTAFWYSRVSEPHQPMALYGVTAYTNSSTFNFYNTLWCCFPDTTQSEPDWSWYTNPEAPDTHMNDNVFNPLWIDASPDTVGDFQLQSGSQAIAAGTLYTNEIYDWFNEEYIDDTDYSGKSWANPPSLGAYAAPTDTCCTVSSIAFGNVYVDSTATDSFYIYSCGCSTLIDSIHNWGLPSVYTLMEDSAYTIAGGDTQWFTVRFIPTAATSYPDTFDPGPGLNVCLDVIVSGTGISNTCCTVSPPTLFGQTDVDATATDSFFIHNCASEALHDSIDWDLNSVYTLTSDSLYNIAADDTVWFTVEFTPTAAISYRDTIDTGHPDCYDVILWGSGFSPIEATGHYRRRRY